MADTGEYVDFIVKILGELLQIDPADIDIEENFIDLGLKSSDALYTMEMLNSKYRIDLDPAILFEHSNVKALAGYLADNKKP